ncbi:MAG TPA: hypothetical protein VIN59_06645 [Alphaproteobacteria bacterium]
MTWSPDIGPSEGPFGVRIDKGEWVDASRGKRVIPYKVYHPETMNAGPYPVIIWSHGLGGTRDGAGFIARHLASHGYIQVNIQHGGTDDVLWRGMPGHPWDNIKKAHIPFEVVRNRYLDVPFALDQLEGLYPDLIDWDRLGMSGHSFGALTTQVMAGQLAGRPDTNTPADLSDDRFVAGMLYSPVPAMRLQMGGQDVYAPIHLPLMHMTGTEDYSPVEGFGYEKRLEVFEHAGNEDQHLVILNGADHMVFSGSRGQLKPYDSMDAHQDMIKVMTLAWWEAQLNDDGSARTWISQLQDWLGNQGAYNAR